MVNKKSKRKKSKILNTKIIIILGIFENVFIFYSFEIAQNRPKLYTINIKYEEKNKFVTIFLPKHNNIILLKINKIQ